MYFIPDKNELKRSLDYFAASIAKRLFNRPEIDPFRLYYVDPGNINLAFQGKQPSSILGRFSPVKGGDWDREVRDLEEYDTIYSFNKRFNGDVKWEETDFYSRAENSLKEDEVFIGRPDLQNTDDLKAYLNRIDTLYNRIRSEGYRTQEDLYGESDEFWVPNTVAFERHEVTVNIGRDGTIILDDGWHRLSLAKVIGIDSIPVRINLRHKKWQKIREKALKGKNVEEYKDHPDIKPLIEEQ